MCTINMTFEVPDTKAIDIEMLKQQMQAFFNIVVATPSILKQDQQTIAIVPTEGKAVKPNTDQTNAHTAWVQAMAKYRILSPYDDKESLIESLDERYK